MYSNAERLDVGGSFMGLEMEDAEWMLGNWPKLDGLHASPFHPNDEKEAELEAMLRKRNIDISNMCSTYYREAYYFK